MSLIESQKLDLWKKNASNIAINHGKSEKITKAFLRVLSYANRNEWRGACHATAAILTVLLKDQGITADLCIGEAAINGGAFDHSWVEIHGAVFDTAIAMPLTATNAKPPVMNGIDLETGEATTVVYGVDSGHPRDAGADLIYSTPFSVYMDGFPKNPKGLWGVTEEIGKSLKATTPATVLKRKYSTISWKERK